MSADNYDPFALARAVEPDRDEVNLRARLEAFVDRMVAEHEWRLLEDTRRDLIDNFMSLARVMAKRLKREPQS
jgi:hypothetical protein